MARPKARFSSVQQLFSKARWCKGAAAKDCDGYRVGVRSAKAESFCLIGAVQHVYGTGAKGQKIIDKLHEYIYGKYSVSGVADFNDTHARTIRTIRSVVRKLGI